MNAKEFVRNVYQDKEYMVNLYFDAGSETAVGQLINSLEINTEQKTKLRAIIDGALTDAYYSLLLGLDGCASIGGLEQTDFQLFDEEGNELTGGEIEAYASEFFH